MITLESGLSKRSWNILIIINKLEQITLVATTIYKKLSLLDVSVRLKISEKETAYYKSSKGFKRYHGAGTS
jgi:hypothetical protein